MASEAIPSNKAIECVDAAAAQLLSSYQLEFMLGGKWTEQRLAGTEQNGLDVHANLIDQSGIEQGLDKLASAHDANLAAALVLQTADEAGGLLSHEVHVRLRILLVRAREH